MEGHQGGSRSGDGEAAARRGRELDGTSSCWTLRCRARMKSAASCAGPRADADHSADCQSARRKKCWGWIWRGRLRDEAVQLMGAARPHQGGAAASRRRSRTPMASRCRSDFARAEVAATETIEVTPIESAAPRLHPARPRFEPRSVARCMGPRYARDRPCRRRAHREPSPQD